MQCKDLRIVYFHFSPHASCSSFTKYDYTQNICIDFTLWNQYIFTKIRMKGIFVGMPFPVFCYFSWTSFNLQNFLLQCPHWAGAGDEVIFFFSWSCPYFSFSFESCFGVESFALTVFLEHFEDVFVLACDSLVSMGEISYYVVVAFLRWYILPWADFKTFVCLFSAVGL